MVTTAQRKMIDNAPQEVRGDIARDFVSSCRRIVITQIAAASRENDSQKVEALTERRDYFDREFNLVIDGDKDAINRALNEHAEFMRGYYKEETPKGIIGLDGGPS